MVSADTIVHELLTPDTYLGQQIIREFGSEIVKNGHFSRKMIADQAFNFGDFSVFQPAGKLIQIGSHIDLY